MYINSLEVGNFRNYNFAKIEFHEKTNILYGDNAQGKTNVLEGIYLCSTSRSHKGSRDREMILMGQEDAHLKMFVEKNQICHKIDVHLKKKKAKGIAIDGIPVKKSSDLLGMCHVVFFSPEDLAIIQNGPEARRKFIDMELCQLDHIYLHHLTKYKHVLKQRNELLKQISINSKLLDTLDIWNSQLVEYGTYVIKARTEFVRKLNGYIRKIHNNLTGGKENIELTYEPNVTASAFAQELVVMEKKDLFTKTTNTGPHRDDLSFVSENKDLRKYGSRGQQRTGALSLKLTEIQIVEEKTGEKPLLLLDDVLSELDRNRQNYLLEHIKGIQTIITCTGLEEFVKNGVNMQKTFEIVSGSVKR